MAYLIALLISALALAGFVILTKVEARRTVRVFSSTRERLDHAVMQFNFLTEHIDFVAFLREVTMRLVARIQHDVAHATLQIVRAAERLLTRLVKRLRSAEQVRETPRESVRPFIGTLSEFKEQLAITRPVMPEIPE